MQKILSILFFLLLPFQVFAADYDAFILNFLRVKPMDNKVHVDISLGSPKPIALEKALQEGQILKFSVEIELIRERFLRNKSLLTYTKDYYLQYEPLARQFMIRERQHNISRHHAVEDQEEDWKIILRNTDPYYLLETLVNNLHYQIPITLEHDKQYQMIINTHIKQIVGKNWTQKSLFFLENDIIQPAQFEYKFDY